MDAEWKLQMERVVWCGVATQKSRMEAVEDESLQGERPV